MKIAISTLYGEQNFGNRLQCYAFQHYINQVDNSISVDVVIENEKSLSIKAKNILRNLIHKRKDTYKKIGFEIFEKNINYKKIVDGFFSPHLACNYDKYFVGSDQVWNVGKFGINKKYLLAFTNSTEKYSFSASFGISYIPKKFTKTIIKELSKFKAISVREDRGKEIVEELTGRKDVEVLVDPTMLLTAEEWDKVSKKPKMLKTDKYILNYFLGDLSDERRKEIDRVAKENNCEVINILDKNSPFYECGPSEFLYLEKHAFLICTDSFHSCVFAILYNTPFLVFDREQENLVSMNSRLDTLLSKFKLENRRCNGKITKKDLTCDYKEAYKILEKERIKADKFLRKALDIKDSD